jgi:hypothetical protein
MDKAALLKDVCHALLEGERDAAGALLGRHYPFNPAATVKRGYGPLEATRVFVRDGFVDRYSGQRLLFPPVLRVISAALPEQFPYHPNWKTTASHQAYWELVATVDHVIPICYGGLDDDSNWVTTSMVRNRAKLNATLEELGWRLHPAGKLDEWDGLIRWFLEFTATHPETATTPWMAQWGRAAARVLNS